MPTCASQDCCCQCPIPAAGTADPCLHRSSNTHRQVSLSLLWGHCSFALECTRFCWYPSRVSVSPSPEEVLQSNPTVLQSQISWGFPVSLPDCQIGKSDAQSVGMGFDFGVIVPLLLSHCSFSLVLGCGVSYFGGFQPPVNGCSATSCFLGVFTCSLKGCTM